MNVGSGTFKFTAGTGQFAGATGQGTMDVITKLPSIPTTSGTVDQEWRGMITLVPATVPGDYNQNGTVDAADYVVWRHSVGQTGAGLAADGDGSGTVDDTDYGVWRANFDASGGSGTCSIITAELPAAVPEPTTVLIGTITVACVVASPTGRRRGCAYRA